MAKAYDYVLAVWLKLEVMADTPELKEELREYLEAEYKVVKLEVIEEEEDNEDEITISLQL